MAISIGQRDQDIEGIPRQRQKIVWFLAFTAEWRHGASLPVYAIAINGIVAATTGGSFRVFYSIHRQSLVLRIEQSSRGLRRCVAVYLPIRLPSVVPTFVL